MDLHVGQRAVKFYERRECVHCVPEEPEVDEQHTTGDLEVLPESAEVLLALAHRPSLPESAPRHKRDAALELLTVPGTDKVHQRWKP
jgi:hypothetical protein